MNFFSFYLILKIIERYLKKKILNITTKEVKMAKKKAKRSKKKRR